MNSMIKKAVVTGAAAAAALGVGMGPAAAATVTVSGGPNFTAVSTNTVLTTGTVTISCTKATAAGAVVDGSYTAPAQIGNINSSKWGPSVSTSDSCTAFGASATVSQNGTWQIWATGASSGGVTPIEIRNVYATVQVASLGCTVTVGGPTGGTGSTVPANWSNSSESITFTGGTLTTTGTGFCPGLGLTGSLSGTFFVTGSPTDPIVLS